MSFTKIPRFQNAIELIKLQKELNLTAKEFSDMHILITSHGVIRFLGICEENSPRAILWQAVWAKMTTLGFSSEDIGNPEVYQLLKWEIESVLENLPIFSDSTSN